MIQPPDANPETTQTGPTITPAGRTQDVGRTAREIITRAGPLIALILLSIYLSLATPYFLSVSNLTNVVRQSSITAILAVGQTLVIISSGIDLSVGAIAALSSCVAAVLMTQQIHVGGATIGPVNFWMGLPIALLVGLLAGAFNGFIITRARIPDFIATLGTLAIFRGVALLITDGLPIPSHLTATELKGYLPAEMIWMGSEDLLGIPVAGWIALLVVVIGWFILRYTSLGRSVYAVGGNREAARVSGINIDRTKLIVYAISGITAAIGGFVLAGRLNSANALMAEEENLRSIAAVVIGGSNLFGGEGGVFGSLIGALIMGVLGNGMNLLNLSAFWQRIIQGVVIILVVVFDQWRRRRFILRR
ncbi:MAG TPA: ABC transporter permease [Anaerolineales bacterium]|nr:ABC transporter permease [Anaerolineales bacterium]